MHFVATYRERATLKDGRAVIVRLLRETDRSRLARGFARLSPEGRYRRFLTTKTTLSAAELGYLTDIDQQHHVAIGAVFVDEAGLEKEGAGVARFIVLADDPKTADAAITVVDDAQGQGLGSLLFARLAAAAVERGVRRFRCDVLAENEPMLAITRGLATITSEIHDGVATIEFELPGAPHDEPPEAERQSAVLRWFATGAATLREFLAWRWHD